MNPFMAIRKTTFILAAVLGLFVTAGLVVAAVSAYPALAQKTAKPSLLSKLPYFKENTTRNLGRYLTDANGRTLYTYGHDKPGVSRCSGACREKWSSYGPEANDRSSESLAKLPVDVGVISNSGGQMQFTWKGLPIYRFNNDKTKGDTKGVDNLWHVIKL